MLLTRKKNQFDQRKTEWLLYVDWPQPKWAEYKLYYNFWGDSGSKADLKDKEGKLQIFFFNN